jgi:lysophospholipase L1-like esterase
MPLIGAMILLAGLMIPGLETPARAEGPFAIRDGDRVVFYGDSITDQRLYTTFIETYVVTRFPEMNVSFVHSGWGGDRVTGGGGGPIDRRLERDVFAYKPTVVTVMLGMNDASYQPFKQSIFDTYAGGYQHLVASLKEHLPGARITLIQPSPFDDVTRRPTFDAGYNQVLLRYGEFVRSLAEKEGATVADLNTPVVASLKKAREIDPTLAQDLIRDRVHPGPAGQLLMAEALLKAWNAPAVVTTVEIDAGAKKVVRGENTQVEGLATDGAISWTQRDSALPMPIDLEDRVIALAVKASDVEQALNRQILKVTGLEAPRYRLKIDDDDLGEFTRDRLAAGLNLAEHPTPMLRQATFVHVLTLQHNNIHFQRWRMLQVPFEGRSYPSLRKAMDSLDTLEADVVADRRSKARPVPHRFELAPR